MPLTATKLTAMLQAKVAPLLRLAASRWLQYFLETDLENSKIVYTFVVLF